MTRPGENGTEREAWPLLAEPPGSAACLALRQAAFRKGRGMDGHRAYVWGAIGVDARPCPESCGFCSLGEAWGLVPPGGQELSTDEVVERAAFLSGQGAATVTLRTTQHYGAARLAELGQAVRRVIRPGVRLACNTGECAPSEMARLREAGFDTAYHVVRLREGEDTRLRPESRAASLRATQGAGLEIAFLVEPVGPEHTPDELADRARMARQHGAAVIGAMARVPVRGTPLYDRGAVSEERLACLCAYARLCDHAARLVCVHPPGLAALRSGANVVVVEMAANPRDEPGTGSDSFRGFGFPEARALMAEAGLAFCGEYHKDQASGFA